MDSSNNVTNEESNGLHVESSESNGEDAEQEGKIKFKSKMQREEAIHYFEAVVTGLRKGRLQFRQGDEQLSLTPAASGLKLEMKAEKKDDKERLSFELSWHPETETPAEAPAEEPA